MEKLPVGTKVENATAVKVPAGAKIQSSAPAAVMPAGAKVQSKPAAKPAVTVAVINKSKKYSNSQIQVAVNSAGDPRVAFFPSGITPKGAKVFPVTDATDLKHIY